MKLNEKELKKLPETLSLEQVRIVCHISKLTARFYVKSGLLKSVTTGKQTRCYKIRKDDLMKFAREYHEDSSRFLAPDDWYKNCGHRKPNRHKKPIPPEAEKYCKYEYYTHVLEEYPDLMTALQVSEFTGYCRRTVQKWCSNDILVPIMFTPKILIPKQRLLELLVSDFYECLKPKSATHIEHLTKIYEEYEKTRKEKKRNEK